MIQCKQLKWWQHSNCSFFSFSPWLAAYYNKSRNKKNNNTQIHITKAMHASAETRIRRRKTQKNCFTFLILKLANVCFSRKKKLKKGKKDPTATTITMSVIYVTQWFVFKKKTICFFYSFVLLFFFLSLYSQWFFIWSSYFGQSIWALVCELRS